VSLEGDIERLVARDHPEPHRLLGAHPVEGGAVVRVLRPEAEAVSVVREGAGPARLELCHPAGLWEGVVPGLEAPFRYRLEVRYAGGTYTFTDPYSFLPTLGDLDLHLAGEGRHEALYERLGAHVREVDGVEGVSFAVWAPGARSVSVVGDFNGWDGRLHPLRALGASGIWELFVPDVEPGARYKYEVRGADGVMRLKADPSPSRRRRPR